MSLVYALQFQELADSLPVELQAHISQTHECQLQIARTYASVVELATPSCFHQQLRMSMTELQQYAGVILSRISEQNDSQTRINSLSILKVICSLMADAMACPHLTAMIVVQETLRQLLAGQEEKLRLARRCYELIQEQTTQVGQAQQDYSSGAYLTQPDPIFDDETPASPPASQPHQSLHQAQQTQPLAGSQVSQSQGKGECLTKRRSFPLVPLVAIALAHSPSH
jgi:hypothetical protein